MPSPAGVIPTLVNMQGMVTGTTCFVNVDNFDPITSYRNRIQNRVCVLHEKAEKSQKKSYS